MVQVFMSSTGDMLEMSVVRGVGGVCDICMSLARGSVGRERGGWMRELGLGPALPILWGQVECWTYFCVLVVVVEWVGGLDQGRERRVLCLADTCTSEVHPVFNPVAPNGYLLSDMYLFMADITHPDSFV